jgi:AsmA family protein
LRSVFRIHRLGRATTVLAGALVALVVAAALFDWNWLRGPLERYLSEKSRREVRIAHLHVTPGLEPTIRVRGVYVENAPWADRRPMAVAREASFTVSLASIWRDRPIISLLVIVDADVDLERQANGLRNWRLVYPDSTGPGRIRVLALEAHRSRVRFVNRAAGLDLVGTSTPLAQGEPGPGGQTLTSTITLEGEYKGAKFSGSALAGRFLSFRDSNLFFPLRGQVASDKTKLEFDGMFADLVQLGPMDAGLRLSGPTLARLHPFIPVRPAPSRPYRFEAHVKQAADVYDVSRLKGRIGDTNIAGDGRYDRSRDRPLVRATLTSDRADFADLAALAGFNPPKPGGAPGAHPVANDEAGAESARSGAAQSLFPARPLPIDALKAFDVEVKLDARELRSEGKLLVGSARIDARLADGALETKTLDLGVAGGRVSGAVAFDGGSEPPAGRISLDLKAIRLEQLLAAFSLPNRAAGAINGLVDLKGSGASLRALLKSANGSLQVNMNGGRISNLLDAKLGLNPLAVLGAWLSGKSDVAVHCAAAAFEVRGGMGELRTIALDTDRAYVDGVGKVNLAAEQVDLLLRPERKKPAIFDRREAIRVRGPFRNLKVSLEKRVPGADGAPAAYRRARCGQELSQK